MIADAWSHLNDAHYYALGVMQFYKDWYDNGDLQSYNLQVSTVASIT